MKRICASSWTITKNQNKVIGSSHGSVFRLQEIRGIFWSAEKLIPSHETFCCIKSVSEHIKMSKRTQNMSNHGSLTAVRILTATVLLTVACRLSATSWWLVTLKVHTTIEPMHQADSFMSVQLILSTSHMKRWWGIRTTTLSFFIVTRIRIERSYNQTLTSFFHNDTQFQRFLHHRTSAKTGTH